MASLIFIGSGILSILGAAALAAVAYWHDHQLAAIQQTPPWRVGDLLDQVRAGLLPIGTAVEVTGIAETQTLLRAPYSDTPCVAFRYVRHEEREQAAARSWDGKTRKTETAFGDDYTQCVPEFQGRDPSGAITIVTAGASFDLRETVARYEEMTGLSGSKREIWRPEWALPTGSSVFVHGYLHQLGADPHHRGPFLISFRLKRSYAEIFTAGASCSIPLVASPPAPALSLS
ncbi:hypothetical protein [uncultured Chloroflexus sp.]|uniref:hypothetical protein n=1 Tax=uncultured Chloroflexus sp. TaxID=214040 RepID=UPI0026095AFA|nr:hypothetical protein [uncultured Chloroflexus sp.]